MIKKISLLLVALLLLGTLSVGFVGCSATEELDEETTVSTTKEDAKKDNYVADDLPSKDFGGQKVIILTPTWRNTPDYILQKELKGDGINEAMVNAYYAVAERFNMEIELLIPGDQKVVQTTVDTSTLTGETSFDIVYNHDLRTVSNAINGCFLNIKSMDLVNLDKPWWTATSRKFQIADKLYFTSSYLGLWAPYMNFGLYYNKNIAETNNITIPYEDIKAGNWYIDDLIKMTKDMNSDIDGDGAITPEKDRYGFTTSYHGNISAQTNLVGTFITQDSNGNNKISANVERYSNYMDTMQRLYSNGLKDDPDSKYMDVFSSGRSLFVFTETRILVEKRNEISFNWGMLPFPKYDENQENYSSAGYDLFWGVNRNVSHRSEIVATAIEALSCQNYNNVIPAIWEDFFGYKLSENSTDFQMVCIVRDATFVNPDYAYADQVLGLSELLNVWDSTDVTSVSSHITTQATLAKVSLGLFVDKISKLS